MMWALNGRPSLVYFQILYQMFKDLGDELDKERIIKSATGIRNTVVWKKLFHFQRDGVTGAIDKLERIGGCIIADSVGLGKTFEALAVIKYYELRNDRVLVLCPKRLRDNMFFLLPAMMAQRFAVNRSSTFYPDAEYALPRPVDWLFERVIDLERHAINVGIRFPAGGSRVVVARRT